MKIILKELAFEVLITTYNSVFSWKRKGLEGPQVTIFSIMNYALTTVRLFTTIFLHDFWDFMWISGSWNGGHIITEYNVIWNLYDTENIF